MRQQDEVPEVELVCLSEVSNDSKYSTYICENCLKEYIVYDSDWGSLPRNHQAAAVTRFGRERIRELRALREFAQSYQLFSPRWGVEDSRVSSRSSS